MSAWDIAGAVVWTPLAAESWREVIAGTTASPGDVMVLATVFSLAGVFCIARLFGAHA